MLLWANEWQIEWASNNICVWLWVGERTCEWVFIYVINNNLIKVIINVKVCLWITRVCACVCCQGWSWPWDCPTCSTLTWIHPAISSSLAFLSSLASPYLTGLVPTPSPSTQVGATSRLSIQVGATSRLSTQVGATSKLSTQAGAHPKAFNTARCHFKAFKQLDATSKLSNS